MGDLPMFWTILFAVLFALSLALSLVLFLLLKKKERALLDAACLAHDLSGACGIVRNAALTHRAKSQDAYGDMLCGQSAYISSLCKMLCGMLRKEPFTLKRRLCMADQIVRETCADLDSVLHQRGIELQFTALGNCLARVDELALKRIVHNLIVNASEAMDEGRIDVIVDGQRDLNFVELTVRDDGAGMDEETISHIFDADTTKKDDKASHGLGLAGVKSLVTRQGGTIKAESQKGKGTSFQVCFRR